MGEVTGKNPKAGPATLGAGGISWNDIAMVTVEAAMTELFDAEAAASQLAAYVEEVMRPPEGGASLGAILGAHIFKTVLRDVGYAIVPLAPTPGMVSAFRRGWFRNLSDRYDAMVSAAWPDISGPEGPRTYDEERPIPQI